MAPTFAAARDLLQKAVADRAFPAAVIEVGDAGQPLWREAFGRLTFDDSAALAFDDTIFDLASLTKVLATAPLVMQRVERGPLALDDPVGRHISAWRAAEQERETWTVLDRTGLTNPNRRSLDRDDVTVRDLLAHCSGLPAYRPLYREHRGRAAYERAICTTPLEYVPRSKSIYSDLGFMLLGFMLESSVPLATQFDTLRLQMGAIQDLQFHPPPQWKNRTAPTQQNAGRGRLLVGEVDDDNAWALGGAAGQAGLFGTAASVGECARHVLQVLNGRTGAFRKETLDAFINRQTDVPGSSRALGWDTMLATSSCGTRMSPRAFGHTGFTGTSLWIDPDRAVYVVLLTNRVYPTATNDAITRVRPAVHDAVMGEM